MDDQNIEKTRLIGNSMGGGVAQYIASRAPDRISKLVLVDSAGFSKKLTLSLRVLALPVIGELLIRPNRKRIEMLLNECVFDPSSIPDDFFEIGFQAASDPGFGNAFLTTLRSAVGFTGLKKEVLKIAAEVGESIKAPTLVIWGKQDRVLPASGVEIARERISNTKVRIFDDCGHMPQLEHSEEFNHIVEEFLSS